ncbi:MAG: YheU family protein [Myxococcales bacterium]
MTPLQIPLDSLSPEALDGLIEEFVTRDGTDYGLREKTRAEKKSEVLRQLQRGEVVIVFDSDSESCNILPKEAVP